MIFLDFYTNCNFDKDSVVVEIGSRSTAELFENSEADIYLFEPDRSKLGDLDGYIKYFDSAVLDKETPTDYLYMPKFSRFVPTVTLDGMCNTLGIKSINYLKISANKWHTMIFAGATKILETTEYVDLEYMDGAPGQLPLDELLNFLTGTWVVRSHNNNNVLLENVDYRNMLISDSGFWKVKNMNEHVFDESLASSIVNYLKEIGIDSCYDFGCGPGMYTEYFNQNDIDTLGFDGNPYTPELTDGKCDVLDLTSDFVMEPRECVMTLEVGEHIPKEFEGKFIDNIVKHSKNLVILSWGITGQGGYGHVNCQENEYIKDIFKSKGFSNKLYIENMVRLAAENTWFKNTIMIFKKDNDDDKS